MALIPSFIAGDFFLKEKLPSDIFTNNGSAAILSVSRLPFCSSNIKFSANLIFGL